MDENLFQKLKEKYVSALGALNREHVHVEKMDVENNKLVIRGKAPSEEAKNKVWDAIKRVDPNYSKDLVADISVEVARIQSQPTQQPSQPAPGLFPTAGEVGTPSQAQQTYTVQKGDTLSKIAKHYYNDPNEYRLIFEANRDQLKDPDKIFPGQVLKIPPAPVGKKA